MTGALLEFRAVEAGYGPFRALFGVSFSVPSGSVTALLGPSSVDLGELVAELTALRDREIALNAEYAKPGSDLASMRRYFANHFHDDTTTDD